MKLRRAAAGRSQASVIAITERLKLTDVATLDLCHFTLVRPKHTRARDRPYGCGRLR